MTPLVLVDRSTGARAEILPELGFNCFVFQAAIHDELIDVLDSEPGFIDGKHRPSWSGIPLLFPFPSRIREGKFTWNGKAYHLPANDQRGNAIHGLAIDRPWRVVERTENSATGRFQLRVDAPDRLELWPADFQIDVRYEVRGPVLHSVIRILNTDKVPLPWGLGTHAYFKFPLVKGSTKADCLAQAPASEMWLAEGLLPTGERRPVSGSADLRKGQCLEGLKLDDCLTGVLQRQGLIQSIVMDAKAGLQISQVTNTDFHHLVVYTPPHGRSVCIEPYTCTPDAINLHNRGIECGWQVLPPGKEFRTEIEISVEPILA